MNEIKSRMGRRGITQVDMIFKLRERGFQVQPPMMSSILKGAYTYPKAKRILAECEKILDDLENNE